MLSHNPYETVCSCCAAGEPCHLHHRHNSAPSSSPSSPIPVASGGRSASSPNTPPRASDLSYTYHSWAPTTTSATTSSALNSPTTYPPGSPTPASPQQQPPPPPQPAPISPTSFTPQAPPMPTAAPLPTSPMNNYSPTTTPDFQYTSMGIPQHIHHQSPYAPPQSHPYGTSYPPTSYAPSSYYPPHTSASYDPHSPVWARAPMTHTCTCNHHRSLPMPVIPPSAAHHSGASSLASSYEYPALSSAPMMDYPATTTTHSHHYPYPNNNSSAQQPGHYHHYPAPTYPRSKRGGAGGMASPKDIPARSHNYPNPHHHPHPHPHYNYPTPHHPHHHAPGGASPAPSMASSMGHRLGSWESATVITTTEGTVSSMESSMGQCSISRSNSSTSLSLASNNAASQCNLYVAELPQFVDDEWLYMHFRHYGPIVSAKVMVSFKTKKSKGYGFVQFTEAAMATAAIEAMNGFKVGENVLLVKLADRDKDKGSEAIPSEDVYICNLPAYFGSTEVHTMCLDYGPVASMAALTDPRRTDSGVLWLVHFFDINSAISAVQHMNGRVLKGYDRPLEVKFAENAPKEKAPRPKSKKSKKAKAAAAAVTASTQENGSEGISDIVSSTAMTPGPVSGGCESDLLSRNESNASCSSSSKQQSQCRSSSPPEEKEKENLATEPLSTATPRSSSDGSLNSKSSGGQAKSSMTKDKSSSKVMPKDSTQKKQQARPLFVFQYSQHCSPAAQSPPNSTIPLF